MDRHYLGGMVSHFPIAPNTGLGQRRHGHLLFAVVDLFATYCALSPILLAPARARYRIAENHTLDTYFLQPGFLPSLSPFRPFGSRFSMLYGHGGACPDGCTACPSLDALLAFAHLCLLAPLSALK